MTTSAPARAAPTALRTIALAGNPNSGKTTVFNALTGLRQKVANYPGVTVERKVGRARLPDGTPIDVIDLPGTYSLIPSSPDEQVTADVLLGRRADTARPDAVVVVVDASNLARSLYLVSQLIDLHLPMVVALNMEDIARRRGLTIDHARLAELLGVSVVPMVGHHRHGVAELTQALVQARRPQVIEWPLPPALLQAALELGRSIGPDFHARDLAMRLLVGERGGTLSTHAEQLGAALQAASAQLDRQGIDVVEADVSTRYRWIDGVVASVVTGGQMSGRTLTERVDGVLMHPVAGLAVFVLVMGAVFTSVFVLAKPLMDLVQGGIGALGTLITAHLAEGPLKSLINDGIFAGVGTVVTFVPQIAILFLFLAVLEDSGYLARAAFHMDRLLARVGLHGKSFIPLLSSFACAIPGILATRTIDSRKDRLATILIAPFMSCSARLPVYTLLIQACFNPVVPERWQALAKGLIMLACYLLGILAAAGTAWLMRSSLRKRSGLSSFILEMPSYKIPQPGEVLRQMWLNASKFLTKAGTVIFTLSVLMWAAAYWPRLPEDRSAAIASEVRASSPAPGDERSVESRIRDAQGAAGISQSYAGRFGHALAPALAPIGVDWKTGIGLVGAFAAREVFVSTLGIVYGVGNTDDSSGALDALHRSMQADRTTDHRPVWTPLVAASVLVWFVLAMQCMSTVAVVRRETGGWGWPIAMLVFMNVLAYVACLGVYQVGTRLFALSG